MSSTRRRLCLPIALLAVALFAAGLAHAQTVITGPHVPGELIVKFAPHATEAQKAAILGDLGAVTVTGYKTLPFKLHRVGEELTLEAAIDRYSDHPLVDFMEPNYILQPEATPDDERFGELWGLRNTGQEGGTPGVDIDAVFAWDLTTGSADVIVAVIDTGVDYDHPDLADNIWTNPGEIPGNGIDDDNNGFVDDVRGWDFFNGDNDPMDEVGHGTHCAGTIGAVGNDTRGVAGVNWNVSIMPLKFMGPNGGPTSAAAACLDYAVVMGARITSNSWGGYYYSAALHEAIIAARDAGVLFVASAGNNSLDTDIVRHYPSGYMEENVLGVAATDRWDDLATFSNHGTRDIHLAAPGVDILSTAPGGDYRFASGTSMAGPHVAGVAALVAARFPDLDAVGIKARILAGVDPVPGLEDMVTTAGRLNAYLALADPDETPPAAVTDLAVVLTGSSWLDLTWTAVGDDGLEGTAGRYDLRVADFPLNEANFDTAEPVRGILFPGPPGSAEGDRITDLVHGTTYNVALRVVDKTGNVGPMSNVAVVTTLDAPIALVDPGSVVETLPVGGSSHRVVTLANTGSGTLDYILTGPILSDPDQLPYAYEELAKGEADTRTGDVVTESLGGPDNYGYRWVDSNDPLGPVFDWLDISTIGAAAVTDTDDWASGPYPLPFDFPFYGEDHGQVYISSNGTLTLENRAYDYVNQRLPSPGAPPFLIAPFWDDLFVHGGAAYYYVDGDRFIVQWEGVTHVPTGGPYSFQAILHRDGSIIFQYRAMGEPTNSATIGLQNGNGTDGLMIAFNTPYVTDGLAVRLHAVPQWVTVSPRAGTLWAGEEQALELAFDAAGLLGGAHEGTLRISSNDPAMPVLDLPVLLDVEGTAAVVVAPDALDFGELFVGAVDTLELTVANPGTDILTVSGVTSGAPGFAVDPPTFTVPAGGEQVVAVVYAPTAAGQHDGTLTLAHDASGIPPLTVALTGSAVPGPVLQVQPGSHVADLASGETATQLMVVFNTGAASLDFDLAVDYRPGAAAEPVGDPDIDLATAFAAPGDLGIGGPDDFGYRWVDSDQPGGPVFSWTDISGIGIPVYREANTNRNDGPAPIGFPFKFYGRQFSSFRIATNGYITFDSTRSQSGNVPLPNVQAPLNMLAPFWDNLAVDPEAGSNVYYHYDGSRLIVQYDRMSRETGDDELTFQVILHPDGTILFQYLTLDSAILNSCTVGLQNSVGFDGQTIVHNGPYLHENMAIRIQAFPDWLTVNPDDGAVPAGGGAPVGVVFDATGMFAGRYEAEIVATSNDPAASVYRVPAALTVRGVPLFGIARTSIDFGDVYLGASVTYDMLLANRGTADLTITGLDVDNAAFGAELPLPLVLGPMETRYLTFEFASNEAGPVSATATIISDDPVQPAMEVSLTGMRLDPPVATVSPARLDSDLVTGQSELLSLNLTNAGLGELEYRVSARRGAAVVPVYDPLELEPDEVDPRPGILGAGGPDVFGYHWQDSDDPGGPVFDWVDISATGSQIFLIPNSVGISFPLPVGFAFPFYGETFETVRVNVNGWMTFGEVANTSYNSPLPSSSAPAHLVAVFFDDLGFSSPGENAYYQRLGDRFVVQWDRVGKMGTPGEPNTFQVILHPDGTMIFQYLKMSEEDLESATIGLQNGTRDDGLTVVFNQAYVYDGLAIRVTPAAQWMAVNPDSGTLPAGASVDLQVAMDAAGLFGGTYDGTIFIESNDPLHGVLEVPVALGVTGAPQVAVDPAAVDFGGVFPVYGATLPVKVINTGTALLQVTGILPGRPEFTVTPTAFDLQPYASREVTVAFMPGAEGLVETELTILSNADDSPLVVPLAAEGVRPPVLTWQPTVLEAPALPGGAATRTVRVCNTGHSDLGWGLGTGRDATSTVVVHEVLMLEKGEEDPRAGILGVGGPDAFGYAWVDSDDPGGPVYSWVDISTTGTPVFSGVADDASAGPFPLGFAFPFYGETFTDFHINSNGYISFTDDGAHYTNQPLPSAGAPGNLVAPLWDDLIVDPDRGGQVYRHFDGDRLVVQFMAQHAASSFWTYNVQLILTPDGGITYQYRDVAAYHTSITVGIQNGTGSDGLMAVFNAQYVREGLAIRFAATPPWLRPSAGSGVVAAGACTDIPVIMDAAHLDVGDHTGTLTLTSNDPEQPSVGIDVLLHVGSVEAADLLLDPTAIVPPDYTSWMTARVELPEGLDPAGVDWSTVRCNGVVAADSASFAWDGDFNDNGVPDLRLKFPLEEVHAILPEGDQAAVTVTGEVGDTAVFTATGSIRVIRPVLEAPNGGGEYMPGQRVPVTWTTPPGWKDALADLLFTPDDGATWELLASDLGGDQWVWEVPPRPTEQGRIRVFIHDQVGLLGFDSSDAVFIIGGQTVSAVAEVPTVYRLGNAYPNPFNPVTRIAFDLPKRGRTQVAVYDIRGRRVAVLMDEALDSGSHSVTWYGKDDRGARVASGVYFYRIRSRDFTDTKRMTLLK